MASHYDSKGKLTLYKVHYQRLADIYAEEERRFFRLGPMNVEFKLKCGRPAEKERHEEEKAVFNAEHPGPPLLASSAPSIPDLARFPQIKPMSVAPPLPEERLTSRWSPTRGPIREERTEVEVVAGDFTSASRS
ncbi:hypothetical protein V2J09_013289 [Rumex salicifolius]